MISIVHDGYKFNFSDAIDAYVFDEQDSSKPRFHNPPMKAVDIICEVSDALIFIEIKEYPDTSLYNINLTANSLEESEERKKMFKFTKDYIKYKFRDTYLCKHAEDAISKPIHYIFLTNFDNALNITFKKALYRDLPTKKPSDLWKHSLAESFQVMNLDAWNEIFPKWQASKI